MSGENITTTVKGGETLSLYSNMYNVKIVDIKKANNIKTDSIQEGKKIVIPIGQRQKTEKLETEFTELNYYGEKLFSWDKQLQELRQELYNPKLTPEKREELEEKFIWLQNRNKERKAAADVSLSKDKKTVIINVKQGMEAIDLKLLYNLKEGALRDFIDDHNRRRYVTGEGMHYDNANIYAGDVIYLPVDKFNHLGFVKETMHSMGLND